MIDTLADMLWQAAQVLILFTIYLVLNDIRKMLTPEEKEADDDPR